MQGVAVEDQRPDRRVVDPLAVAAPDAGLLGLPQLGELRRTPAQVAQQGRQVGVVGVARGRRPQAGHDVRGGGRPVLRVGRPDGCARGVRGVGQEQQPVQVAPVRRQRRPVAVQRGGHRVPGEHVALRAEHQGRQVGHPVDQSQHAGPHVHLHPTGPRRGAAGEVEDLVAGVVVEPQRPGEGTQHLRRRHRTAALLEADDVVDADAGQHRHLLATQPRGTPVAPGGHPDVLRAQPLPGAAEHRASSGRLIAHTSSMARLRSRRVGPPVPRSTRPGRTRTADRTVGA